jgi:Acetyltransferase (GNAT) domain
MLSPPWTAELAHSDPTRPDQVGKAFSLDCSVQVLRGATAIQAAGPEITELLRRTGQDENPLLSLDFFLGRVRLFPGNEPVVLLVRAEGRLEGAVYLYEKLFLGRHTGYLRGFDHLTGESSVIADERSRVTLLEVAMQQFVHKTSARVAWATVRQGPGESDAVPIKQQGLIIHAEVSSLRREHRLKLSDTFTATLASFGPHTRRNLRYYRRRAEKELEASFNPELTFGESDQALRELSERSFQPFEKSLAEWRKMDGLLRTRPGYFAIGLRARGKWISYLVGMRAGTSTYVLLQMNHSEYARYSLSTVLRSYFFEHEITRGQQEIKFVNGTCAAFQRCCESDRCVTVTARRGLAAFVLFNWIAPWHSAPDHALNMKRWICRLVQINQKVEVGVNPLIDDGLLHGQVGSSCNRWLRLPVPGDVS